MSTSLTSRRQGFNASIAVKVPCAAATTVNITLSGNQTVDGVALVTGDRCLVKNQTDATQNGIYSVDSSSWQRTADWDGALDVGKGTLVYVHSGTTEIGFWYVTTSGTITPGTTSVSLARASSVLGVISAFAQTLVDDEDADSLLQTLVAALTAETGIALDDTVLIGDTDEAKGNTVTVENFLKALNLLTEDTDPVENDDYLLAYDTSASGVKKAKPYRLRTRTAPGGRLTLTTAVPVTTSDVTGATTVYYTPYHSDEISLYDGTAWMPHQFTELSQATSDTTKSPAAVTTDSNYDVFVWNDSGTLRATRGPAWSSDTARGTGAGTTELEHFEGRYVNTVAITNGPAARRGLYAGTIRSDASSQINDSLSLRHVWNTYNRVPRAMRAANETANSWTYTTGTIRQANANAANQLDMVIGLSEDEVSATALVVLQSDTQGQGGRIGIGVDSTTAFSTNFLSQQIAHQVANQGLSAGAASWSGYPGVGRHYIAWLEMGSASGTTTWFGDNNIPTSVQSGIEGSIRA